ncbi:MAG TPA: hypothetical protein VHO46_15190, partial [Bacteroidales bacterium]|nr:hypothetical protein [Bacteroidales bacterium]
MKTLLKKTPGPGILVFLVILIFITGTQNLYSQGVGISEAAIPDPHPSSILELRSTMRGFLAPRLTSAQRMAIASPANGLLVFDTDTKSLWYYDGADSKWKAFASGELGASNQLLGMNAAGTANEYKNLNGTTNQINVTFPSAGNILLSTPQDIHSGASPVFNALTLTNPLTVANGGTGLNAGISGGIPYYNSSSTMASSSLLIANGVVVGGGAGTAPATIAVGSANTVLRGTGAAPVFGQIVNGDISNTAGISAEKISSGDVDNNEFNYLDGLTSAAQTQLNNLQTELDVTQAGSGLNADGTYTANGSANYISGATSLKNADDLLDAAIDASATDITGLQTEVDNIETGSGLNGDGTYTVNAVANYISGATSLKNADDLLDTQLKTTSDDLTSEVTDRTNADAALQTELDATQTGSGLDADGTYTANGSANYISAATSLKNADDLLDAAIDASATDITDLQTEVDNIETGSGLNADGTYTVNAGANYISGATSLKNADDLLDTQLKTTTDDLADEVSRATTAEGTLTTNLATEVTAREDADTDLQTELDATQTGS